MPREIEEETLNCHYSPETDTITQSVVHSQNSSIGFISAMLEHDTGFESNYLISNWTPGSTQFGITYSNGLFTLTRGVYKVDMNLIMYHFNNNLF